MSDTTTDCYDTPARIEALRRGLRGLPLPPAAMPPEYARVWRERMRLHREIAGLMAPAPAPAGEGDGRSDERDEREKLDKRGESEERDKRGEEQRAWDAPRADWDGGARRTR